MGGKDPLASWPASSPDISPLDFSVWADLKWKAIQYSEKGWYKNREEAKNCLKRAWADMDQTYIGRDLSINMMKTNDIFKVTLADIFTPEV